MQRSYINIADHWGILAYYDVNPSDAPQLIAVLREFGCPEEDLEKTATLFDQPNHALTFNAPWARMSVVAIGWAENHEQFYASVIHEIDHLQDAILRYYDVAHGTEQAAYLQQHIAQQMHRGAGQCYCPQHLRYRCFH